MTFTVSIIDDLEPEEDETVFVVLTEVYLIFETSRGKDVQQHIKTISSTICLSVCPFVCLIGGVFVCQSFTSFSSFCSPITLC